MALWIPNAVTIDPIYIMVFATATAGSQMLAILWALLPKIATSHFARPTYQQLPYASYAVFGVCSYITGMLVSLLIIGGSSDLPMVALPWKGAFVFSLMNAVTTIGASILIDVRLKQGTYDYRSGVLRDALILALAAGLANVGVQQLAEVAKISHTPWFILIWTVVGFMVGYLLPSSAAAHLAAREANIERDVSDGAFLMGIGKRRL